jgi:serine/threonine protein kinase
MQQFGGKNSKKTSSDSKRHFTVVMGNKEHGLYVSSTPSSAAKKVVTKLCAENKSKKVQFHIREITQGSKKKTYGPYVGHIEKLKEPIKLKDRIIKYKPITKLSRKTSNKTERIMKGGGYTSTLSINKGNITDIIYSPNHNSNDSLVFTVTEVTEPGKEGKKINYTNIKYLGKGTYGKVFLVADDKGDQYVIKITNRNVDIFLEETKILDEFMNRKNIMISSKNGINKKCQYKAISQGKTTIDGETVGHIIFPYKGDSDFDKIVKDTITNDSKINLIPKILRDILTCLIDINKYASHADLKLNNIVYNEETKTGFIIDFGLAITFPIKIESLYNIVIGNRQISIDIIIGYLLMNIFEDARKPINELIKYLKDLYSQYLFIIGKSIDNFGLFWIIIECISDLNIFDVYLPADEFLINSQDDELFDRYLNFYFNLDIKPRRPKTLLRQKLEEIFNYKEDPNLRQKFIEDVFKRMKPKKFQEYFKSDKNLFYKFMNNILELITVDPTERLALPYLIEDPFFEIGAVEEEEDQLFEA